MLTSLLLLLLAAPVPPSGALTPLPQLLEQVPSPPKNYDEVRAREASDRKKENPLQSALQVWIMEMSRRAAANGPSMMAPPSAAERQLNLKKLDTLLKEATASGSEASQAWNKDSRELHAKYLAARDAALKSNVQALRDCADQEAMAGGRSCAPLRREGGGIQKQALNHYLSELAGPYWNLRTKMKASVASAQGGVDEIERALGGAGRSMGLQIIYQSLLAQEINDVAILANAGDQTFEEARGEVGTIEQALRP